MGMSPIDAARALHQALEAGVNGEALRGLFSEDAGTIEQPNLLKPRGANLSLEQMISNSIIGAGLLAQQRYELVEAFEQGDVAILKLVWTGDIARDVGTFRAGQQLRAYIAQFVTTRHGRIAKIETYDCYEPFDGTPSHAGA